MNQREVRLSDGSIVKGEGSEHELRMMADKQYRHRHWKKLNMQTIKASGVAYKDRGETLLFREPGKPKVDFYPSTGRWRVVGHAKQQAAQSGGGRGFLKWYAKQEEKA